MDRFRLRVWNNKTKEFVAPMDWSYWDGCFWYEPYKQDVEPILMDIDYYEIEQCTGLKDKKCVLVYEHDLIKFDDDNRIFEVFWDKSNFCWALGDVKTKDIYSLAFISHYNIEIIGNIHENKDLLEEKND